MLAAAHLPVEPSQNGALAIADGDVAERDDVLVAAHLRCIERGQCGQFRGGRRSLFRPLQLVDGKGAAHRAPAHVVGFANELRDVLAAAHHEDERKAA